MAVTVREATAADVDGIRRVAERGWRSTYESVLSRETIDRALGEWYAPERTAATIENEDVAYVVAVDEDSVVGYASGAPGEDDGVASLGAIYVDPDRQGEGIRSALLERFEEWCESRGVEAIEVRVLSENEGRERSTGVGSTNRSGGTRWTCSARPAPRRSSGRTSADVPRRQQC